MSTDVAIVIPAFDPPLFFKDFVLRLTSAEPETPIVLVNDGSSFTHSRYFSDLAKLKQVIYLEHQKNLGKGAAIKTALRYLKNHRQSTSGAVTADADGQHCIHDISKMVASMGNQSEDLLLGTRSFDSTAPVASRIGNHLASGALFLSTGQFLKDTQTGLRGIPSQMFESLLDLSTNGYDFETDMLFLAGQQNRKLSQVPIKTIYLNKNKESHFNPFWDSAKILYCFLRFSLSSLTAFFTDTLCFIVAHWLTDSLWQSLVFSRLCASVLNFYLNFNLVFKSKDFVLKRLAAYTCLVVLLGFFSFFLISKLHMGFGLHLVIAKVSAEGLIFAISFSIQRTFIFKPDLGQKKRHLRTSSSSV